MKKLTFITVLLIFIIGNANAQKWLEKVAKQAKDAAKAKVEQKVNDKAVSTTEKAIIKTDTTVNRGISSVLKKKEKPAKNKETTENQTTAGAKQSDAQAQAKIQSEPRLESYSKYDFVPGEKVIFFADFSNTNVGDFPPGWNTDGSGEVVNTNLYEGKWLKYAGDKCIWTDDLLELPENYTIEFDVVPIKGDEGNGMAGWGFRLMQAINAKSWDGGAVPGKAGFAFGYEYFGRPYYRAYDNEVDKQFWDMKGFQENKDFWEKENQKHHVAIWVQKSRIRVYHGNGKMFDLPKAIPDPTTKFDRIRFDGGAVMFTNLRIAVGAPDMRSKLLTEGKLVSYGIYFDVNKDVVKPESYGTLKEIAQVLKDNPDVKVKIVGHTDSDGDDALNLDLSRRRGAAVKSELVKSFGIHASRLESDGMGEKQPVAKNDTPADKALNRRVEFVKM